MGVVVYLTIWTRSNPKREWSRTRSGYHFCYNTSNHSDIDVDVQVVIRILAHGDLCEGIHPHLEKVALLSNGNRYVDSKNWPPSDSQRKSIRVSQHRCTDTLTIVRYGGKCGIEYLGSSIGSA